jgi:hypothetical protein
MIVIHHQVAVCVQLVNVPGGRVGSHEFVAPAQLGLRVFLPQLLKGFRSRESSGQFFQRYLVVEAGPARDGDRDRSLANLTVEVNGSQWHVSLVPRTELDQRVCEILDVFGDPVAIPGRVLDQVLGSRRNADSFAVRLERRAEIEERVLLASSLAACMLVGELLISRRAIFRSL